MNVFEKIREKLHSVGGCDADCEYDKGWDCAIGEAIEIVNQVEQEHNNGWIPCSERLPEFSDNLILIQCSGKPRNNLMLEDALCLALYTEDGWILEEYPEWDEADVIAWQPLPEPFVEK